MSSLQVRTILIAALVLGFAFISGSRLFFWLQPEVSALSDSG